MRTVVGLVLLSVRCQPAQTPVLIGPQPIDPPPLPTRTTEDGRQLENGPAKWCYGNGIDDEGE